ncbi:MAG: hypothetical protein AB7U82_23050 [Blastocatellales bacterium]
MKKNIIRAIAVLSLMASFSTLSAYAQAPSKIKFEAPFAFTVGNKTLPAGKYSIQRLRADTTDILVISSADNRHIANFGVMRDQLGSEPENTKVVFSAYGDKRFLKKIQYNYSEFGYELPKSSSERDAIKKARANKDHLASAETMLEVIAISGR